MYPYSIGQTLVASLHHCFPFRCTLSHVDCFKSGNFPMCAPSKDYANTMIKGLVEGKRLSEEEAVAYMKEASTKEL